MLFNPTLIAALCFSFQTVHGHMMIKSPAPRCSKFDTQVPSSEWDYSYTAPIGTHDIVSQPLCKHSKPERPVVIWKAGQRVTLEFDGTANHGGGWCQIGITYDLTNSPGSFVRVGDPIPNCPINGQSISVTLPSDLPASDHAVGTWIWNNKQGNREMYMNCFDIKIEGSSHTTFSGPAVQFFNYGPDSKLFGEGDAEMAKLGAALKRAPIITVPCAGGTVVPASFKPYDTPYPSVSPTLGTVSVPSDTKPAYQTTSSNNVAPTSDMPDYHKVSPSPSSEPENTSVAYSGSTQPTLDYVPQRCSFGSSKLTACNTGAMKCAGNISFLVCDHGNTWVPKMCNLGTKCKQDSNVIACV